MFLFERSILTNLKRFAYRRNIWTYRRLKWSEKDDLVKTIENAAKLAGRKVELDWNALLNDQELNLKQFENRSASHLYKEMLKTADYLRNLLRNKSAIEQIEKSALALYDIAYQLPNRTHPQVPTRPSMFANEKSSMAMSIIDESLIKPKDQTGVSFEDFGKRTGSLRRSELGRWSSPNSYALYGELALLEHALIRYAINLLHKTGFQFLKVSDIVPMEIIEKCGFTTTEDKVYRLVNSQDANECLSGTSEMTIAQKLENLSFYSNELPLKFAAVSRCFRAEISAREHLGPLYRVHEFFKVEMFIVCTPEQSEDQMSDLYNIQKRIMTDLCLCFRTLDMPADDLGCSAYRKFDVEVFLPSQQSYGEVTSCSNCTDYQSRRLNITYRNRLQPDKKLFVHTLNATAIAAPRILQTLIETHFNDEIGTVMIPKALQPYLGGRMFLKTSIDYGVDGEPEHYFVTLAENKTAYGLMSWSETHQFQIDGRKECNRKLIDLGVNVSKKKK